MARNKKRRPHGTGCLLKTNTGWALRWRELEIVADGSTKRVLRYETLGSVSKGEATQTLAGRLALAGARPLRSHILVETLAAQWEVTVLPMYKHSTQKNHMHILHKHLLPKFGKLAVSDVRRQDVQAYVAELARAQYAPKTIDHIHDVLSAVLRTAVKWGHLPDNPAHGVDLPALRTVRPKWVLTPAQGLALLECLPVLPKTIVGAALLTGLRRGELFGLRWKAFDEQTPALAIVEAVYEGEFGTPKTAAGVRTIPISEALSQLLRNWKARSKRIEPDALVFSTRSGKPISPNNILRRFVFPACDALKLPHATWLTFRRTYCSWAHDKGVPQKIVSDLMGHVNVNITLNVYTQVLDESVRQAANRIGEELFSIVQFSERAGELID